MKAPPASRVQQAWKPYEWVIVVDARLDLPSVRLHESFQVIRNEMEAAGIFWIVGDERKVRQKGYTKR